MFATDEHVYIAIAFEAGDVNLPLGEQMRAISVQHACDDLIVDAQAAAYSEALAYDPGDSQWDDIDIPGVTDVSVSDVYCHACNDTGWGNVAGVRTCGWCND